MFYKDNIVFFTRAGKQYVLQPQKADKNIPRSIKKLDFFSPNCWPPCNDAAIKLNRANATLYKIRTYVSKKTLRSIYYPIFDSHINYASIIWGQNSNTSKRLHILQKKALRIIYFEKRQAHSTPLFIDLAL